MKNNLIEALDEMEDSLEHGSTSDQDDAFEELAALIRSGVTRYGYPCGTGTLYENEDSLTFVHYLCIPVTPAPPPFEDEDMEAAKRIYFAQQAGRSSRMDDASMEQVRMAVEYAKLRREREGKGAK